MTSLTTPSPLPPPTDPAAVSHATTAPAPRRQRRNRARPGVSLLAQGEAWVWLTGGALCVAMAMILGLIGYIVWQGSLTFWPVALERFERVDGTPVLGEVSRIEEFTLTREMLDRFSPAAQTAAQQLLGDQASVTTTRRLIRTGNFELTQTHYQWLADFEIRPGTNTFPSDAVTVERLEWGRFFGTPAAYVERYPRNAGFAESDAAAVAHFFQERLAQLPDDDQESARTFVDSLTTLERQLRRDNVRQFLATTQSTRPSGEPLVAHLPPLADAHWSALLADGSLCSLAELADDAEVTELQANWEEPATLWAGYEATHDELRRAWHERRGLERHALGQLNHQLDSARLALRRAELATNAAALDQVEEYSRLKQQLAAEKQELTELNQRLDRLTRSRDALRSGKLLGDKLLDLWQAELEQQWAEPKQRIAALETQWRSLPAPVQQAIEFYLRTQGEVEQLSSSVRRRIATLTAQEQARQLRLTAVDGQSVSLPLSHIIRTFRPNHLTWSGRLGLYTSRWWEFLSDEPREANSEGGIWPAIVGTVCMTLAMSLVVVPFGVLAALYLREYARKGWIVGAVRIAINNLAGVPSIVFGAFGFGFFCYVVGAFLDGGPRNVGITPWPAWRWYIGVGCLAVVAVGSFATGLTAMIVGERRWWTVWLGRIALAGWIAATVLFAWLLFVSPFFGGFYAAELPNPTLGKGGLLWASMTLALLTLPVVIVATEEALSAVPNSLREGSYACGAGKWQTIRRIILPQAMPGILTGMILAMARGAGEVAPLMLVGAVKLAPELPVDTSVPFVHGARSFMHLGFHIFDLGFQSQNSEAAKPMVFTTTLLLIAMIVVLNVAAIGLRSRLRRRYRTAQF